MKSIFLLTAVFISTFLAAQKTPLPASQVLKQACAQAGAERKKVLLVFHASSCGWCRKMDRSLEDPKVKPYFDSNFVITHLVVYETKAKEQLENPGAEDFLKQHNLNDQGIPIWVVLDKEGSVVADCMIRPEGAALGTKGKNTGCPASAPEVDHFITVLKKTTSLNDTALEKIRVRFRQNEQH